MSYKSWQCLVLFIVSIIENLSKVVVFFSEFSLPFWNLLYLIYQNKRLLEELCVFTFICCSIEGPTGGVDCDSTSALCTVWFPAHAQYILMIRWFPSHAQRESGVANASTCRAGSVVRIMEFCKTHPPTILFCLLLLNVKKTKNNSMQCAMCPVVS